jgi:hypothetical protein
MEYYFILRSVLRSKPYLRGCLTRCKHCRIFFITHPRNAGRDDLGCPFGCSQSNRRLNSTRRSIEYYQTKEGKVKKRQQNGRRKGPVKSEKEQREPTGEADLTEADTGGADEDMMDYLQMVTGLIEERVVPREEINEMVSDILRQHSIGNQRRIDYIVGQLNKNPP